jgi:ribonuclease HI
MNLVIYTDGGVTGDNKDDKPCYFAYVAYLNGKDCLSCSAEGLGTSNQAEYKGLLLALNDIPNLIKNLPEDELISITFKSDSKIMVNQINSKFKAKDSKLIQLLFVSVLDIQYWTSKGINFTFEHVPREENKIADLLCNLAKQNIIKTNPFQSLSDFKKQHNLAKYKVLKDI